MDLEARLSSQFARRKESEVHAHDVIERAGEFSAYDAGSPELEYLELLHSLIRCVKPGAVLETGTGHGLSAIAIATALRRNGAGHLWTIEVNSGTSDLARRNLETFDSELSDWVTFEIGDSLDYLVKPSDQAFDFAFFDSLIPLRHQEFQLMLDRSLLASEALCAFHDTSRSRGITMHDYSQETIDALDQASSGRQWLEFGLSRGLRLIKLG